MSMLLDTSGVLAIANSEDQNHQRAATKWRDAIARREPVYTSSYIIVESVSLLRARYGAAAVRRFRDEMLPPARVVWIDEEIHATALSAVLAGGRRGPSLVDCTSFEVMCRRGLDTALAFDHHFTERGYMLPPTDGATGT